MDYERRKELEERLKALQEEITQINDEIEESVTASNYAIMFLYTALAFDRITKEEIEEAIYTTENIPIEDMIKKVNNRLNEIIEDR